MDNVMFVVVTDKFIVPVSEIFIFERYMEASQLNARTPLEGVYNIYSGPKESCEKILAGIPERLDKSIIFLRKENIDRILES